MKFERTEYPRPYFRRESWQSLNGEWEFEFDDGKNGVKRGIYTGELPLKDKINVPFSYEYKASGIGDETRHDVMWYRRKFTLSECGRNVLLCFNAADYSTDVWVNGKHAAKHEGGFTPFNADITDCVKDGENVIVVRCADSYETAVPRGKQRWKDKNFGCFYIPNSGIWQSVWIEYFDGDLIESYKLESDIDNKRILGALSTLNGLADGAEVVVTCDGKIIDKQKFMLDGPRREFTINLKNDAFNVGDMLWWDSDNPKLLYVDFTLFKDGKVADVAHTRMGLRKVSVDNYGNICLNDRVRYQRLVLDQGYWEESGLTPPSAEALKKDIELAKAMGFNGARKHQKFEDPYFYYYAEELGFLVWCEMPSAYTFCEKEVKALTREWQEIVSIAKNFTSVIAYVPLNESWGTREIKVDSRQQNFAKSLYYTTKALDSTRLISINDGFESIDLSDIISVHDYDIRRAEDFPVKYNGNYDGMYPQGWPLFADGNEYLGQPVIFSEFGGIALKVQQKGESWGYNEGAKDGGELVERLQELIKGISLVNFKGYCYTQLTDVQQEINGLLYADRTPKADLEKLKEVFKNK